MKRQHAIVLALACVSGLAGCQSKKVITTSGNAAPPGTSRTGAIAPGTIVGSFRMVGGPAPGTSRPLHGGITVHVGSATGTVVGKVVVGPSGWFSVNVLPDRRYILVGKSPQMSGRPAGCPAFHPVTVSPGDTVHVRVVCEVK